MIKEVSESIVIENTKGFSNNLGSLIILVALAWFVVGYEYYSIKYIDFIFDWNMTTDKTLDMFKELGEALLKFILNGYEYVTTNKKIDITLYMEFYYYFWSFKYTLLIFIGTYLKVSGTPILRVKKIVGFSLVLILTLLIEIPL